MSRYNVLFVNHSLAMGGIETMIRDFALRLRGAHFHPSFAVFGEVGSIGVELISRGISVVPLLKREGVDWRLIGKLRSIIRNRRIDVVHSNNYSAWLYSVLAALGTGAVVVHTEHSKVAGGWRRHMLERFLARRTGAVVAVSAEVRRAMTEDIGIPERLIRVIENGVDTERFARSADQRGSWRSRLGIGHSTLLFGIVARLAPVKAHDNLLSSFHILRQSNIDARLVIAGDGPCRSALENQCRDLGLSDAVIFLGEVQDPAGLLSAMDVYVLPSHSEGMNLTLLEAMSTELPVVATAVGGNPEVVKDEVTGILVPANDPAALSRALGRMASDGRLRMGAGQAGRDRVCERFSQAVTLQAYTDLYSQVLARQ